MKLLQGGETETWERAVLGYVGAEKRERESGRRKNDQWAFSFSEISDGLYTRGLIRHRTDSVAQP